MKIETKNFNNWLIKNEINKEKFNNIMGICLKNIIGNYSSFRYLIIDDGIELRLKIIGKKVIKTILNYEILNKYLKKYEINTTLNFWKE